MKGRDFLGWMDGREGGWGVGTHVDVLLVELSGSGRLGQVLHSDYV